MRSKKEDLPVAIQVPGAVTSRAIEWGDTTIVYAKFSAGADATPLLAGLPGDLCGCPHWGVVLSGAVNVTYGDGTRETSRAGDVFHWPAPHTVQFDVDTEILEFSPQRGLRTVYEHIGRKVGQTPFPAQP
jgi:hypothetical protein